MIKGLMVFVAGWLSSRVMDGRNPIASYALLLLAIDVAAMGFFYGAGLI